MKVSYLLFYFRFLILQVKDVYTPPAFTGEAYRVNYCDYPRGLILKIAYPITSALPKRKATAFLVLPFSFTMGTRK